MSSEPESNNPLDFSNTELAFVAKSDQELKDTARIFKLMKNSSLVNLGSKLGLTAIKLKLPFVKGIIKKTMFKQFCGGETLLDCQDTIDKLYKHNALTILDYGAEGKNSEEELDEVAAEIMNAVNLAASNESVPVVVAKLSGLSPNDLLERIDDPTALSEGDKYQYDKLIERIDGICKRAYELKVGVFIDAEESWMQEGIDMVTIDLMKKYNREYVVVYNTYQMYRHDRLERLKSDHQNAVKDGYKIGAKVVRGAYMDKENARAKEQGYPTPIQPDKASTDRDYDAAIAYAVKHYEDISVCCATHNLNSSMKMAKMIEELELDKSHPHFNFSQLYGMSDNITFNLTDAGYNVGKYLPYGPVEEVIPYLIRRAQENTSITGEMTRELSLITIEVKRRGL